jgi:peptide-methionine (S)-S-oxide reductase
MLRINPKNSFILPILLTVGLALLGGCAYTKNQSQVIENVTPEDAFTLIQNSNGNKDFVILDVRTPEEFSEEHIGNAINLNYYSKAFIDNLKELDKHKTYLVYCRSGNRSGKALSIMEELGYVKAYNMLDGINRWKASGLPVSNDSQSKMGYNRDNSNPGSQYEETDKMGKATFAAGCFWGIEAAFRQVKGVLSTAVGYTGGTTDNPTYRDVCTDKIGHAEAVLVEFDPSVVSYDELLDVFWNIHDPTTLNRQGPDFGSQYRSGIFYHNEEQKAAAIASKERLEKSGKYRNSIVTEITPASEFYMAEEYHQQYLEKRGLASCGIK